DINIRTSSSGRIELWIAAINGGLNSPLWGQGSGSFAYAGFHVAGPHNLFLSLLHDYGLLVFGLSLAVLWQLLKNLQPSQQPLLTLLFCGIFSAWLFTTATPALTTVMTLLISCLLVEKQNKTTRVKKTNTVIVAIILFTLTGTALHDFKKKYSTLDLRPRIWLSHE
ncbi:MAG: O-antigen ligase family protein, partial [Gammaproteobacteria bacterium]|nr:O-antigen ligase family protein [Gammaproteobacteria bacterium]